MTSQKRKKVKIQDVDAIKFNIPIWLSVVLISLWFYVVTIHYFPKHRVSLPFVNMPDSLSVIWGLIRIFFSKMISIFWFSALLVISYRAGQKIINWLKIKINGLEYIIFCTGVGFCLIAYIMFATGILGLLYKTPIRLVVIALTIISVWKIKLPSVKEDIPKNIGFAWWLILFTTILFVLLNGIMSLMPEIFYDSLVYHLACPNFYLIKHKIVPMEFLAPSNYPLNLSMIYQLALCLDSESLAKIIHFSTGIFTLLLIYANTKRLYSAKTGIISAALFYSIPIVSMNSWTCGNDIGLSFFFALSFFSFVNWLKEKEKSYFVLCGIFAGVTLSTKYTVISSIAGLGVALSVMLLRYYPFKDAMKKILIFGLIVFMFIIPWLAKNYAFTKNPVHPFLYGIFGEQNLKNFGGGGKIVAGPLNIFNFGLKEFLISPWTKVMEGNDSSTFVGPLFLLFFPLIFIIRPYKQEIIYMFICFAASYIFWFAGAPLYRYLLPSLICLSVVVGWAMTFVTQRIFILIWAFLIFLITNLFVVAGIADAGHSYGYITGKETKDELLSRTQPIYPHPSYSAIKWLNKNLPQDAKVLFVGDSKSYYTQRDYISYCVEQNLHPLIEYLKESKDVSEFRSVLDKNKITHLLINYREAMRVNSSYKTLYCGERERKILDDFWKDFVKLEYFDEGTYLYSILREKGKNESLNILEELEKRNWKEGSLLSVFIENKMWDSAIDEYETYLYYGFDVRKQLDALYRLTGQDGQSQKISVNP
ncbi:MAG: glycosyltransferase family 39 protein [Elusimicrobiota bacterium]